MFRKQYEKQVIPSNLFWEQVMNEWQASPWLEKLQRNLLLWLQLVILTLLMFALIKPFWMTEGVEGDHIILIVDTSASMTAIHHDKTRFKMAQEELTKMVKKMNDQDVTLISAGNDPMINLKNETNKDIIESRIKKLQVSYQTSDINKALRLAESLAHEKNTSIHLFSDSVKKADLPKIRRSLPIHVHNIGEKGNNLSLLSFGVAERNKGIIGVAVVENQSDQKQDFQLNITFEDDQLFQKKISIRANEQKVIKIPTLPKKKYYVASIHGDEDYTFDNKQTAVFLQSISNVYAVGDVNPFLIKGFETVGVKVTQLQEKNWKQEITNGMVIMEGQPKAKWPNVPLFIVNSNKGKSVRLTKAIENDEGPLMQYVQFEDTYIQSAAKMDHSSLETIARSGEIPLIEKGEHNGNRVIAINFGLEDSDWPLKPGFPIFLYHSYQWLAKQQSFQGFFRPGERKWVTTDTKTDWKIYDSEGEYIRTFHLQNESFVAPKKPGLYQIVAGEQSMYFAVVLDESEQSIRVEPSFDLNVQKDQRNMAMIERPNSSVWNLLVLVAFAVLLIEWEVYRRGLRR